MSTLIQYMTRASAYDGEWKWQAAGMCYIIKTDGGRFVIIDGGHVADAEDILSFLKSMSDGMPDIAMWILTHPHGDHIGALGRIASDEGLLSSVNIDSVCFCAPKEFTFGNGRDLKYELALLDSISSRINHIEPKRGDVIFTDEVKTEFLFTYKDTEVLSDPNELSMVFSITLGKNRVMFTGDAYHRPLDALADSLGDSLRSDLCQLAHHALNGGSEKFYSAVGARTVLVPISKSGFEAMKQEKYDRINAPSRCAISMAERAVYAFEGTQKLF